MILVTLGTQDKSFKRLLEKIEEELKKKKIKDRVVVQAGHTVFDSKYMEIKKLIPMDEFEKLVEEADILITHGGVGSIISGLNHNKKVIACARLKKYQEHTNDHQLQIIDSFTKDGYILNLDDYKSVSDAIKAAKKFKPKQYKSNQKNMIQLIDNYIDADSHKRSESWNKKREKVFDNKTKTILSTTIIFLLFYCIFMMVPLTGDDFGNYFNGSSGIWNSISFAINSYQTYEGRFFSRIFINVLTYNKILWNMINALCMTGIYYYGLKMIKVKNMMYPLLLLLGILLVDEEAFRQGYIWLAGNITYLFPTCFVIISTYLCTKFDKVHRWVRYILPIFAFIFSMFVENVSIVIVTLFLIFTIIHSIHDKKISKSLLMSTIFSFIGMILTICAPGNMNRLGEYSTFKAMNLFDKVVFNLPNFISYTFLRNSFLLILIFIVILLLVKRYVKKKSWMLVTCIYLFPLLVTSIVNYAETLGINISKLLFLVNGSSIWIMIYYFSIIIMLLILLFYYYQEYKKEYASFALLIGAILSNGAMFLSPIWGGRTALPTTLLLTISLLIILSTIYKVKYEKVINSILFVIVLGVSIFFINGYIRVYKENKVREEHIRKQLNEEVDVVEFDVLSERFLWNPNPWDNDGYLAKTMKQYYKIDADKEIKVVFDHNHFYDKKINKKQK